VKSGNLWDIFCKVIDNYGDIGICWRLAAGLSARGEHVRLWLNDSSALAWLAPQGDPGVEIRPWSQAIDTDTLKPGHTVVEAFGCEIPGEFLAAYAKPERSVNPPGKWINLEYLSAESFAERSHGLPSPVSYGPGAGLRKYFFYPGFSSATGGLLREPDLAQRQAEFNRAHWLQRHGIEFKEERLVCLFCYEPPALGELLEILANDPHASRLLVTAGRATAAVKATIESRKIARPEWNAHNNLSITYLPALSQIDFDHLLWTCDLNFVRGEDSLVRALWANKAFVWQIYPQHDAAHRGKLDAFLNRLQAPYSLRTMHQVWNGLSQLPMPKLDLPQWQQTVEKARDQLLQQDDLVTQIIRFASKTR
jgi:uncharacterized repeat protein (TIGR03837 family)